MFTQQPIAICKVKQIKQMFGYDNAWYYCDVKRFAVLALGSIKFQKKKDVCKCQNRKKYVNHIVQLPIRQLII